MAQATETDEAEGTIESYRDHGVFVPSGLTAAAIMEGAWALERLFDVAPFVSRMMARAVLHAAITTRVRNPVSEETD